MWSHTGMPPVPLRWGLIRNPHNTCRPHALRSTEVTLTTTQSGTSVVHRWQGAVPVQEGRTQLGVETHRPWAALAIARTPPLLGWFSGVPLLAQARSAQQNVVPRQAT